MSLKFEPSEAQMESCRQQFLQEGGKALAKWGGAATLFTSAMSLWPAYRNLFNWRGQIFCVMGAGIAGFWIRGEQAVLRCHHARDAQRLKDIYEGRTMG
ncbi:uncharacterized protein ACA1_075380 [Acanthamoeba castellanii str. Neff]|uniref:Uncharacterized protein n=1 Tax=Acanthamoeba castellanii (strain ATCC 30010 / Neff) TaxID=1257118 RepID=L8HEK3_ACACF|nr:uncharacterized protein ACA1_075380 [Acanthamoeba castellanii str. Neff]ELR23959.1 hypothetical protein ACA1_075380 [Acanthamoeba castellanii str. Neff]